MQGRQEHPSFPRPLIQELALKFPFHRQDPKEAPLEEQYVATPPTNTSMTHT